MIAPKNPNAARNIAATETEKFRIRNRASGTIGSAARDSIHRKTTPIASPARIRPPTAGSAHSPVCLLVSPIRKSVMARAKTAAPT